VDKPHFLPVHPAGKFVNETLINRLCAKYGYSDLCAAHRLDRLTAGLVLCVKSPEVRGEYQQMFMNGSITKTYLAVGPLPANNQTHWHIRAHMKPYNEHFRMQIAPGGDINSESIINLIDSKDGRGLFKLQPITGKKHQLRVHMCEIGSDIDNDPLYPTYSEIEQPDNYNAPMQLLAYKLGFKDPITGKLMSFSSKISLNFSMLDTYL